MFFEIFIHTKKSFLQKYKIPKQIHQILPKNGLSSGFKIFISPTIHFLYAL